MATGRSKVELDLEKVEQLAAQGLNEKQVADALGISRHTLQRRKKESAGFFEALERGKAQGIAMVANALYDAAVKEGNVPAMMFYLKCRAGWNEKQQIDHISSDGSMRTQINLGLDYASMTAIEAAQLAKNTFQNEKAEDNSRE